MNDSPMQAHDDPYPDLETKFASWPSSINLSIELGECMPAADMRFMEISPPHYALLARKRTFRSIVHQERKREKEVVIGQIQCFFTLKVY